MSNVGLATQSVAARSASFRAERLEMLHSSRDALQYYGAGAAVVASLVVSLNLGRLWTGWAMVIFVSSSLALIAWGFLNPDSEGIGWQNLVLLAINAVGVWRYLIVGARTGA